MDPRTIWTAEQLWERYLTDLRAEGVKLDAPDARTQWRMATYAEWLEFYEKAAEHYRAAAADPQFLRAQVAQQRLERMEALIRDAAARETLRLAKQKIGQRSFPQARAILDGFSQKHPEAGPEVTKAYEDVRAQFTEKRLVFFQKEAARRFVKVVEALIHDKVREKDPKTREDVKVTEIQTWARRELPEKAFEALAADLQKRDPAVTPEEARGFWEGRPKPSWRRVSYGAGTFVVNPPKIKPPKPRRSSGQGGNRNKPAGPAPAITIPKPPTRDQWWERAPADERAEWTLAFFVENSELFELGQREYRNCSVCMGQGLITKALQTGDSLSYLCTRCGGAQQDVVVRFR